MTSRQPKITIQQMIDEQREWIKRCGGDLLGYIERYGSADDPTHYGDGGEAIYKADTDHLRVLLEGRWP